LPSDIHREDKDLFTVQDWAEWKPPPTQRIIWDGILNVGGKVEIFGNEGSWKSASALHLAYAASTGRRWLGFKTSPCNVIYLLAEGGRVAAKNRVEKYCEGTKAIYLAKPGDAPAEAQRADSLAYPPNVVLRYIDILHLDEQAGISSLRNNIDSMITNYPSLPVLIIIDPLYKMFHHDLTKANDVNILLENFDLMLYDYNEKDRHTGYQRQLALVVIHHPRKAGTDADGNEVRHGSDESFGVKELSWWFDTVIQMNLNTADKTKTTVDMEFTKHPRNAETILPDYIKLRWDRSTLHPQILTRRVPTIPEDEVELRGSELLNHLE